MVSFICAGSARKDSTHRTGCRAIENGLLGYLKRLGYAEAHLGETQVEAVEYRARKVLGWPFRRKVAHGVDLTIPIHPGPQYRFGEVGIHGDSLLSPEESTRIPEELPAGEVANEEKIEHVRMAIAWTNLSAGRLLSKVEVPGT